MVYGIEDYKHLMEGVGISVMNENPDLGLVKGDTIPLLLLVGAKEQFRFRKEFGDKVTYINI